MYGEREYYTPYDTQRRRRRRQRMLESALPCALIAALVITVFFTLGHEGARVEMASKRAKLFSRSMGVNLAASTPGSEGDSARAAGVRGVWLQQQQQQQQGGEAGHSAGQPQPPPTAAGQPQGGMQRELPRAALDAAQQPPAGAEREKGAHELSTRRAAGGEVAGLLRGAAHESFVAARGEHDARRRGRGESAALSPLS